MALELSGDIITNLPSNCSERDFIRWKSEYVLVVRGRGWTLYKKRRGTYQQIKGPAKEFVVIDDKKHLVTLITDCHALVIPRREYRRPCPCEKPLPKLCNCEHCQEQQRLRDQLSQQTAPQQNYQPPIPQQPNYLPPGQMPPARGPMMEGVMTAGQQSPEDLARAAYMARQNLAISVPNPGSLIPGQNVQTMDSFGAARNFTVSEAGPESAISSFGSHYPDSFTANYPDQDD